MSSAPRQATEPEGSWRGDTLALLEGRRLLPIAAVAAALVAAEMLAGFGWRGAAVALCGVGLPERAIAVDAAAAIRQTRVRGEGNGMQAGRPSDTAEAMAAARAFGSLIYQQEAILDDPYAAEFLGRRYAALFGLVRRVKVQPLRLGLAALYDRILPGSIGWVLTRHRYFDDAIDQAAGAGLTQIVFVGAGYDSRAFRQQALSGASIIEVDHPDTQARKKSIVKRIFGALPDNVRYLPLNATKGDLRQLPEHGFDPQRKTVFVVEGFLWYMPPAVAHDILRATSEIAPPGSQVIFDYILPSVVDGSSTLEGAERHRRYCARRGEPILYGIAPEALADELRPLGLELIDDVAEDTLRERYLRGSRRPIKIYPFLRIARARVAAPATVERTPQSTD